MIDKPKTKSITFRIPIEYHGNLRIYGFNNNISIQDLLMKLVKELLEKEDE